VAATDATDQNAPGREGRHEPGRKQQYEAGTEGDHQVASREHHEGEHQRRPSRQPPGQQRHRRRADHHADGEHRDQQPGLGHAHLQVAGDLGQQARDDELGGEHEERADGQHIHDERESPRQRRPRFAFASRAGGRCRRPGWAG